MECIGQRKGQEHHKVSKADPRDATKLLTSSASTQPTYVPLAAAASFASSPLAKHHCARNA